ncbi:MAG: protein translocase subunit SecD, partial [Candidatus Omnitrophota bacterium]|nr:protein translocase subunit SecD [Candidatus Omnitrophota bacterium]
MTKTTRNRLLIILGVIAACLYFTFPLSKHINFGLDLKGGMHLVMRVETEKLDENAKSDAVLRAIEILRNRIDGLGVGETVIQRQGENQILVQLPGVTDREKALSLIGKVAQLEFRLVDDSPNRLKEAIEGHVPAGYILKYTKDEKEPILLEDKVALSGETIADARVDMNTQNFNQPMVNLKFNSIGARQFATVTKENVGRQLAIVLDNEVQSAPVIRQALLDGTGVIEGRFTLNEASQLALALRSGALPAPMRIEEERTIGPLLGKDSIQSGINAAIMGVSLTLFFMAAYYLAAGVIADIALLINVLLIFGIMGFLNATLPANPLTLTLPGIAGIILTLGMAVDANVLINERMREELALGRSLQAAINNGFSKALTAIIDSNTTTLIAAFMLFQFGSGPIKGFAVTLTIGLLSSLFTAIFVSRTIFNLLLDWRVLKSLKMLEVFKVRNIDFISKRYFCFALSVVMVIASFVILVQKGKDAYGIDFAGGQIQEYKFEKPIQPDQVRAALQKVGLNNAVIQQFNQFPENIIVRTSEDTYDQVVATLKVAMPDNPFATLRIEKVGPVVGEALRKRAILAIIFALGGILVYVGFRFKHFDFAVAGVLALLHDVIIAMG